MYLMPFLQKALNQLKRMDMVTAFRGRDMHSVHVTDLHPAISLSLVVALLWSGVPLSGMMMRQNEGGIVPPTHHPVCSGSLTTPKRNSE